MSKRRRRPLTRPAQPRRVPGAWMAGAVGVAAVVVAGLTAVGQMPRAAAPLLAPNEGRVKGGSTAPVTVEEWGDFP